MSETNPIDTSLPPADPTTPNAPNTSAWNTTVESTLAEMGTSLLGGIIMQMMNNTKADSEGQG